MNRQLSIYEDIQKTEDERFLIDEMTDEDAEIELKRLEAAYARFLRGTYSAWSREKRYAHDRRGRLFECLQLRHLVAKAAIEEYEALVGVDRVKFTEAQYKGLKAAQVGLVKLRAEYYAASTVGTA